MQHNIASSHQTGPNPHARGGVPVWRTRPTCRHHAPMALAAAVIRWGPNASGHVLRELLMAFCYFTKASAIPYLEKIARTVPSVLILASDASTRSISALYSFRPPIADSRGNLA